MVNCVATAGAPVWKTGSHLRTGGELRSSTQSEAVCGNDKKAYISQENASTLVKERKKEEPAANSFPNLHRSVPQFTSIVISRRFTKNKGRRGGG